MKKCKLKLYVTLTRMGVIKKINNNKCWEDAGERYLLNTDDRGIFLCRFMEIIKK